MLRLTELKLPLDHNEADLVAAAGGGLGLSLRQRLHLLGSVLRSTVHR